MQVSLPMTVPIVTAQQPVLASDHGQSLSQSPSQEYKAAVTLYVGGLPPFTTAALLSTLFAQWMPVDIKVVKDKCYGFITFSSSEAAQSAIHALNGFTLVNGGTLRVNYALMPPSEDREAGPLAANGEPAPSGARGLQPHYQIFVGDLSASVDDTKLYNTFAQYTSCVDARIMWDPLTRRSKGFGFVTFTREEDAARAIAEVNGQLLGSRRLRCDWAQHKLDPAPDGMDEASVDRANPTSTNIYVGNISPNVDELMVTALFQEFGKVIFVRVHRKGSYGFVGFQDHWSAVRAIVGMHGKMVHDRALKCSWGTMGSFGATSSSGSLLPQDRSNSSTLSSVPSSGGSGSLSQYLDLPNLGSRGALTGAACIKGMPVQTFHHSVALQSMMPSSPLHVGGVAGYSPVMASQAMAPGLGSTAANGMYAVPQVYSSLIPAMAQQTQHPYLMPASMLPMAYKPSLNTVSVAKMVPSMPVPRGYPVAHAWQGQGVGMHSAGDLLSNTGMQAGMI